MTSHIRPLQMLSLRALSIDDACPINLGMGYAINETSQEYVYGELQFLNQVVSKWLELDGRWLEDDVIYYDQSIPSDASVYNKIALEGAEDNHYEAVYGKFVLNLQQDLVRAQLI